MAKNPIAIIRATDNALANLQTRLEATEKLLISISEQARKAGKALGTKTAGGTAKEVESRSIAERKLLA